MLVFLVRFFYVFIIIIIFFWHFSFDSKSISRKHKLADIYKIKIVFSHLPHSPPSLPAGFVNLAPLSLSLKRLTAQRFGFELGAHSELRTKSLDLAFCLASWSKVFLRTSLTLVREKILGVQLLPCLISSLLVLYWAKQEIFSYLGRV